MLVASTVELAKRFCRPSNTCLGNPSEAEHDPAMKPNRIPG
jgi:hypothetical protein